jgi:hypothetical protein
LDAPAALFFARSAHHDVQALLQIGKKAGAALHSRVSCPQSSSVEMIDLRVFFIGCILMSGFIMVTGPLSSPLGVLAALTRAAVCVCH